MPFVAFCVPEIVDVLTFAGLGGGAIGGEVSNWCHDHSNREGCVHRDLKGFKDVPEILVGQADVGPCNVPKYNYDQCHDQVSAQTAKVVSSVPENGVAQFDNIPPACMDLAVVLSGSCTGATTHPVVCGSACIQYTGLTDDQFAALSSALTA